MNQAKNKNNNTPDTQADLPIKKNGIVSEHLWKSRLAWRIALTSLCAIVLAQFFALGVTLNHFQTNKLNKLRDITRGYAMTAVIDYDANNAAKRVKRRNETGRVLVADAMVGGIAVYNQSMKLVYQEGQIPPTAPTFDQTLPELRSIAGSPDYELFFSPQDLGRGYYVVVRLQTTLLSPLFVDHLYRMTSMLIFLALLSTAAIMLALGKWLLDPIILLRTNLGNALKSPEKPEVHRLPNETRDEMGMALRAANELIRQNANNIRRLRAQAEDKIHRLAYYDNLTGLPNRTFFVEKLDNAIKQKVIEEDRRLAVFCVDIDHFKDINDTMGHEFGDKLLEAVSRRLVKAMPNDALVARASADEFSIMVVLQHGQPDSQQMVEDILNAMREPISIMQEQFQLRVSMGVAHAPDDGLDGRLILKNADIALNRAKEEGRDTVRYYSEAFDIAVQQRFQMLRDLRNALDNEEFQLYYQPQFDMRTGDLIGAEALLRWLRPNENGEAIFVPPNDFIPVAEQSSLIVPIGAWVLRTAAAQNIAWQKEGLPPIRIAVNVSGIQFHRADFVSLLADILRETGLKPEHLELELTESIFMENMQTAIDTLNRLHDLGVELSVDDFGTGYSSLSYLRRFPIDRLKIDQSFVRNALTNEGDRMIAKTIINLGHSLNLKVLAEGVETKEHEDFLKAEGCDEAQGYKYSKPIPAAEFPAFIINHTKTQGKVVRLVSDKA